MRIGMATICCAGIVLLAGCQDHEARLQNEQLKAKIEKLEADKEDSKEQDWMKALLASQSGGDSDKKIASLSDDFAAGLDDIKKKIDDSNKDSEDRYDDLEKKIDKVADLEKTVADLKTVVSTLESKLKSLDPKEVLDVERKLISKEAELKSEVEARGKAEALAAELKTQLDNTKTEIEALQAEITELEGEDISSHPQYRKLKTDYHELNTKLVQKEADYKNLEGLYKDLLDRVKRGVETPRVEDPDPNPEETTTLDDSKYDFVGKVVAVSSGSRPGDPSNVMVQVESGDIPPKGAEIMVLGAKNERICNVKVVMLYHKRDDPSQPITELGGATVDEKITKPVTKGDKVVWVRKDEAEKDASAGGS